MGWLSIMDKTEGISSGMCLCSVLGCCSEVLCQLSSAHLHREYPCLQ